MARPPRFPLLLAALIVGGGVPAFQAPPTDALPPGVIFVPTGPLPIRVAVDPLLDQAYVANFYAPQITIIRGPLAPPHIVPLDGPAYGVAADPVSHDAYVTVLSSLDTDLPDHVAVVDGVTRTVEARIWIPPIGGLDATPFGVAVDSRRGRVYAAGETVRAVLAFDAVNQTFLEAIPLPEAPFDVVVNEVTGLVYATGEDGWVVDAPAGTIVARVPGFGGQRLAVHPLLNRVYAPATGGFLVLEGTTNLVLGPFPVAPDCCTALAYDSLLDLLLIASARDVYAVDPKTHAVVGVYPIGERLEDVDVSPAARRVYATAPGSSAIGDAVAVVSIL